VVRVHYLRLAKVDGYTRADNLVDMKAGIGHVSLRQARLGCGLTYSQRGVINRVGQA
jgi:hypothetical protein